MLFKTSLNFLSLKFFSCCSDWMISIILFPDHVCALLYHLVCFSFLLVCFIFKFQILNYLFLIWSFYSSLLKCSLFKSIIFPNLVNIFITKFWIICLVNYLFLFHYLVFQEFSLVLSIESISSAFSFYLTFSASINLGETVTYYGLEGVSLCRGIPVQTVCAECLWWEGWIWFECLSWSFHRVCWQLSPW